MPIFWFLNFKLLKELNSFIFTGTISQIFGTKQEVLSEPWYILFTEGIPKPRFCLKFYSCVVCVKISTTVWQKWTCLIWNISITVMDVSMMRRDWSSRPAVFLGRGVLKICSKFTGKHPCRSLISIKLQSNTSFMYFLVILTTLKHSN